MNPHHDFNAMMGHGGGMPPQPPMPGSMMPGMMPPMPPMPPNMPPNMPGLMHMQPPMPPMPMMGNVGMMPMIQRQQASTPPLFIGHFSNAFQKSDNNKHKIRPTIYSVHEISFHAIVKVEGIHVVPLGYQPDGFKIRGRTKPDMNTRPFELKIYCRSSATKELIPLLLVSVAGGVEWMPLPPGNGDIELDFLAIDGDFDDLSIIIHGTVVQDNAGDVLPPYPHVFNTLPLPGDVARKALVKSSTGEMLEQAWSKVIDTSLAERSITIDSICMHAKLDNTEANHQQVQETIGGMCINSEHSLLPISLLAELVEKIFSVESSDCIAVDDFQQRCQQIQNVSHALTSCWKAHQISNGIVDNELGSVKDIIGEDGSITLCEHIVSTLNFIFTAQESSSQASHYYALTAEDRLQILNTLGKTTLECTRLLLVNEFFAKAFVDMKGDVTLLNLIMQQQQIPLPESLFVLVIQCVIELSGFPLSLAANIFPVTASQQVEANSAYQSLLYTMAGLKAHSSLTAVCGKLINIWTFIAQLRSLRSNLQQILVTDMKQIAQAIHELYATNENIPSGEVTENNESRNKQEAERVSSASYQACERIFACYETILPQVVWLQQSWQRCQHIQIEEVNEQDSETTPSKSWSMAIVDILHHEKFVSIIASILSIRKMVIELTTMMDWIAHPRSHELHHVSASFTKILSHLFELADFEKYVTVLCEKNASTIQYLWVEFGLDQTEESAQGSAIQFAMDMQLLRDGDQAKHHLAQWWCRCYFMQSMRKFVRVARSLFDAEEEQVGGMEDQRELYLMTMMIMNELVGQDCIHRMITQMTSLYFTTWLIKSSSEMIETCFPKNEAVSYSHSRSKFALLCQLRLLADALLSKEGESLSLQFISQLNTVLGRECEDGIKVASELILSTTAYSSMHPDQFVDALLQQPVSCFLSPQQLHSSITVLHTLGHNKQLSSNESHRQALLQLADRFLSRAYHVLQILHGKFMNSMHTPTSMGLQFISTEEVETLEFYLSADKISLSLSLHIQQAVSKFIINLLEMISYEVDVDDHLMVVLVSLYLQINQFTQLSDISTGDQHTLVGYSLCPVILTTISKCLQSVNVSSMLAFEADQHHKSSPFSLLLFLLPHTSHRDACVNLLHELTPDRGLLIDDVLISEFSHVYQTNSAFSSFVAHLQKAEFSKRKLHEVDQNLSTKWKQYLEFCETSAASWKGHALFTHWSYQQDGTELRPVLSVQESIKQCWLAAGNRPSLGNSLTTLTTKVMALNSASYFGIVPITLLQSISILYFKSIGNPKESINGGKIGLERYISVLVQNVEALSQGSLFTTYHFVQHGLLHTMLSLTAHAEISVSLLSLQSCITIYKRLEQCRIALLHTKDEDAVQVSQVRVNIQKVLNYVAMQLIDLLPSLAFKHQEATSYLQQTIFSIQLLPKHVFWNPFVSGFMHVGQGFTVEFIAVKLWIACEESFQYLYELLDVKKQTSMFATVFDQMPFDDLDIENMILEAQGQFAVAINALKAVLELVMWAYETKHITLSIMSKAMRTTLTDPKKVIIRFQRMYTMWTISFATQISEELKANGMDDSTRKDLFSSTNLQELYDARHALISTCLKWLVELTGRYSKFHSAREEKCINSIHVPAIAAEQWRDMSRLIDLRHPWNKTEGEQENNNQSEKLCMEVFSKSQCCQREVRQCLDRKLSCNLHHQDLLNLLHQDIKSQYFKSWNGIDSNVKSANFIMRELLQTRISLKPLSTSETKEDQDEKEIEVLEEFHKYKRQRVAKNILPEDVFEAFNKTLFPVVETRPLPQAEMMQPRPPPPPSADLSSFLASVEMSTEHQNIGESFSSGMDGDMGPNEGQEEEDYRPAVRLQGVPRANKNNANLGKYFQNSNTSFASKKYDDDARRPQQDRGLQGQQTNNNSGNNFSNQSQGRPDFRQRQNPPDRQQNYNNNNSNNNTNNNNFNDDNRQNNNAQGRNNNFDNNRGGNFQDRPRPNNRFDGGRKDFSQERGGDHVYQPPSGANAPPPRPSLPNMPPNFMPPPPPPPMMANLPPGFVPPPRPPAFGQLPPPPFPPQFPPK